MRINHNIQALNTYRQLSQNQTSISKHLERLSSGLRINRAADDAAGLAISEKMRSQIRGLSAAERNALDGVSLIQTAEGALDSVHQMLQRMRELAVQAANGTYAELDRNAIQQEVNQLLSEINRIGNTTEFNTRKLLNGEMEAAKITKFIGNEIDINNLKFDTNGITPFFNIEIEGATSTQIARIDIPKKDYTSITDLAAEIEKSLNTKLRDTQFNADNRIKVVANGNSLEIINDINGRSGKLFSIYNKMVGSTEALGLYGARETKVMPETNAKVYAAANLSINSATWASGASTVNGLILSGISQDSGMALASTLGAGTHSISVENITTGNVIGGYQATTAGFANSGGTLIGGLVFSGNTVGVGIDSSLNYSSGAHSFRFEVSGSNIWFQIVSGAYNGTSVGVMVQDMISIGVPYNNHGFSFNITSVSGLNSGDSMVVAAGSYGSGDSIGTTSAGFNAVTSYQSGSIQVTDRIEGNLVSIYASGNNLFITNSGSSGNHAVFHDMLVGSSGLQYSGSSGFALDYNNHGIILSGVYFSGFAMANSGTYLSFDLNANDVADVSGMPDYFEIKVNNSSGVKVALNASSISASGLIDGINLLFSGTSGSPVLQSGTYSFTVAANMVPNTEYTISTSNNLLNLMVDGEQLSLIIPNGNYSGAGIAAVLETMINSSLKGSKNIGVHYDGNRLVFSSSETGKKSEFSVTSGSTALTNLGLALGMRSVGTAPRIAEVISLAVPPSGIAIAAGQNDQLQVVVDGEPITAVIPAGTYDNVTKLQDLARSLQQRINSATSKAADVTVSFDGTRFTVSSNLEGNGSEIRIKTGSAGDASVALGFKDDATGTTGAAAIGKWDTGSNHDAAVNLQLGANEGQTMGLNIGDIRSRALGLTVIGQTEGYSNVNNVTDGISQITIEKAIDLTDFINAGKAITRIDAAINIISIERSKLGAMQNRLEHTISNLRIFNENVTASESRIRDADMAFEMTQFTKNNIISQSATAMLAQANQLPQGILQLLK